MNAEQSPLFTDPLWTDSWSVGDRVSNRWTTNTGLVTAVEPGRHLLIRWDAGAGGGGHTTRHGSDLGLEREEAA